MQILIDELGMQKAGGCETPADHRTVAKQQEDAKSTLLSPEMRTVFRSCVMRGAYLAQDNPCIPETVKSLARCMSGPTEADLGRLKRMTRFSFATQ